LFSSFSTFARSNHAVSRPANAAPSVERIEKLARALKQTDSSSAYSALSAIALRKSSGVLGIRAALALGYFDYSKGHYDRAAKWLDRAKDDPLLGDYSLYWRAENDMALGRDADALAELKQIRADFPDSVITEQTLQALGNAAIASDHPADAVAALDAYPLTPERPALLFLRAEAREQLGQPQQAAADYGAIYTRFAASEQAREAGIKLSFLHGATGGLLPPIPLDQQMARAAALFNAKRWSDARSAYSEILTQLTGASYEQAEVRIMECGAALGAGPNELAALKINDSDADAERDFALASFYGDQRQDSPMVSAVEAAVTRAPSSHWAEEALFYAANYYWVQLDRDRAASYYQRLEEQFPAAAEALPAHWRVAWVAVLKRQPSAPQLLEAHLRRFAGSPYTPDALYWLGRLAEEANNPALARSYYAKLAERFPENYFASAAAARLRVLNPEPKADPDLLAAIPPAPSAPILGETIPSAAAQRQARADALRSIAFDSSAELELQAAYAATHEPRLLLESAQAAVEGGHYGAAIIAIRQIYPQLDSYSFSDVPREVWLAAYPLPYESSIRRWSAKAGLDPMLVAGLIHQESAFDPEARSGKDAIGMMQLLPKTARLLARQVRIRYSQARLSDPDYNVRLGTAYFAELEKQFGGAELALAAYNAGVDRVTLWTSNQTYREPAEFTDSIPFSETRQYVEIIMRNANIYRQLYGSRVK